MQHDILHELCRILWNWLMLKNVRRLLPPSLFNLCYGAVACDFALEVLGIDPVKFTCGDAKVCHDLKKLAGSPKARSVQYTSVEMQVSDNMQ